MTLSECKDQVAKNNDWNYFIRYHLEGLGYVYALFIWGITTQSWSEKKATYYGIE